MRTPSVSVPAGFGGDERLDGLCDRLGLDRPQAIGHVVCLWTYARAFRQDGNLGRMSAAAVATFAQYWDGDPDLFVKALVASGFLTSDWLIVGWDALAGRDEARRVKDAERKRRQRESQRSRNPLPVPLDSPQIVTRTVTETVPGDGSVYNSSIGSTVMSSNEQQRDNTGESEGRQIDLLDGIMQAQIEAEVDTSEPEEAMDEREAVLFELAWSEYPRRAGGNSKADARRAFMARVRQGVDPDEMRAGVVRYAAYCEAMGMTGTQYVKAAATFFGPGLHFEDPFEIPPSKLARREAPFAYAGSTELPPALRGRGEPPPNPDPGF